MLNTIQLLPKSEVLPLLHEAFRDPFVKSPHPLAVLASQHLQDKLKNIHFNEGKMMGVLVVRLANGEYAYVSAFSGKLNDVWQIDGFVPPIFNIPDMNDLLKTSDKAIKKLQLDQQQQINSIDYIEAKLRLETASKTYERELSQLKKKLKIKKSHRHLRRQKSPKIALLNQLATESQQDKRELKRFKTQFQNNYKQLKEDFLLKFEKPINATTEEMRNISQKSQHEIFQLYQLRNFENNSRGIEDIFYPNAAPSGTGDCAAPKLLHYAAINNLQPLALAEFWWGKSPAKEIRQHKEFYPPCRSKCHKILPFMLQGISYNKQRLKANINLPSIIYEDEVLAIINKPEHMLSIPGVAKIDSVYDWAKQQYSQATGPLLVHRLDQETSGLLIIAKTKAVHKQLQQQFIQRTVKKRYVALLAKKINLLKGQVNLPLRVDLDDRPRQLVCYEYGKPAISNYQPIQHEGEYTRVYFYPYTGRTHQLRLHAAHQLGLNAAIVGDKLYGKPAERMMLHAESIQFTHPITGKKCRFNSKVPF